MYNPPALCASNDRFWQAIRTALGFGPDHLSQGQDLLAQWQSPDLLLAQTCGMPFRTLLHPNVTLIATPDYGLPDCPPGYYRSKIITHAQAQESHPSDFSAPRFAYSEALSQSGWAGPVAHLLRSGVTFCDTISTGSHHASVQAVAEGRADLAGIDALTYHFIERYEPALTAQIKVIDLTTATPTLPYITAAGRDPEPIAAAIRSAISSLSAGDRQALHLRGLVDIPAADYLDIASPPSPQMLSYAPPDKS